MMSIRGKIKKFVRMLLKAGALFKSRVNNRFNDYALEETLQSS